MTMRTLSLFNKEKKLMHSIPAVAGLTSLFKLAKEHEGYAALGHEKRVGCFEFAWDVTFFHNGKIVSRIDNVDGLDVNNAIMREISKLP